RSELAPVAPADAGNHGVRAIAVPGQVAIGRTDVGDERAGRYVRHVVGRRQHRVRPTGGEEPMLGDGYIVPGDPRRGFVLVDRVVFADEDGAESSRQVLADRRCLTVVVDGV